MSSHVSYALAVLGVSDRTWHVRHLMALQNVAAPSVFGKPCYNTPLMHTHTELQAKGPPVTHAVQSATLALLSLLRMVRRLQVHPHHAAA